MCHVRNIPFEEQTNSFFLKFGQGIYIFEETQKSIKDVVGDVYRPTCPIKNCVHLSTNEISSFYDCEKCKSWFHLLNVLFKDQIPTFLLFGSDGTLCFGGKTIAGYEKEKPSPFWRKFIRQSQSSTPEPQSKKAEIIPFMA